MIISGYKGDFGMQECATFPWFIRQLGSIYLLVLSSIAMAVDPMPLFDGHIHYNRDAWTLYPPETALTILEKLGIEQALVSSTPDDGTLMLYELAPERIIPILRPYRTSADRGTWFGDPEVLAYVEKRLERGHYKGIGEFHVWGSQAQTPEMKRYVELAVKNDLFLHAHCDETAVETLIGFNPAVRVLWAHGGMTTPPETIDVILAEYPNVWVELSYRYDEIMVEDELSPVWRTLFLKYPNRFILGTDTWSTNRWAHVEDVVRTARAWIAKLPRSVADKILYENANRFVNAQSVR